MFFILYLAFCKYKQRLKIHIQIYAYNQTTYRIHCLRVNTGLDCNEDQFKGFRCGIKSVHFK